MKRVIACPPLEEAWTFLKIAILACLCEHDREAGTLVHQDGSWCFDEMLHDISECGSSMIHGPRLCWT
jgi:hypothetical protein